MPRGPSSQPRRHMPIDLSSLVLPAHSALLIMECQEGVIGASGIGDLPEAVRRHGVIDKIAALLGAARAANVPVFHLLAGRRTDHGGSSANCKLLALGRKSTPLVPGSPRQLPVAPLTPEPHDYVLTRFHGLTPFHGTELDALLRNLGIRTVVATGVSVNVGITGLTIEAVNSGYQVVLPRDAVGGTPDDYVDAVFRNTLQLLATVTSAAEVAAVWHPGGSSSC